VQLCKHTFCHSFQKCDCGITLFVALFKSASDRTIAFSKRVKMCAKSANFKIAFFSHFNLFDCTFTHFALINSAIVQSHFLSPFFKSVIVRLHFSKVQLFVRTFCPFFQKCDCVIALFLLHKCKKSHHRTFKKSNCAKISKQKCKFSNHTFSHFNKNYLCAITLFKSATNRAIALSKRANVQKFSNKSANFQIALFSHFEKNYLCAIALFVAI